MGEGSEKPGAIIIDTNVLFSSLVKQDGYTQALLSILLVQKDIVLAVPKSIRTEINAHIHEISRKSGLPVKVLKDVMDMTLGRIKVFGDDEFALEIKEAAGLVHHGHDAPFAGLALKLRPSVILTYNKRHFNSYDLEKRGVKVLEPCELASYLDMVIRVNKKVKRKGGILKLISGLYLLRSNKA